MDFKKVYERRNELTEDEKEVASKYAMMEGELKEVTDMYKTVKKRMYATLDDLLNSKPILYTMHINDTESHTKLTTLKTKYRTDTNKYTDEIIKNVEQKIIKLKSEDELCKEYNKNRLIQMKITNGYLKNEIPKHKILLESTKTKKRYIPKCNKERSTQEKKLAISLDKVCKTHTLYYFNGQKFPFCKRHGQLEYDFWCIYIHNNRVIQFVIEYDGIYHEKDIHGTLKQVHFNDILKQYYLEHLNIHLLRIKYDNEPESFEQEIVKFMQQLQKTKKYTVVNKIQLNKALIDDEKLGKYMHNFRQYCLSKRSLFLNNRFA